VARTGAALNQYSEEKLHRHEQPSGALPPTVEQPSPNAAPVVSDPWASAGRRSAGAFEGEARLVTNSTNPVSIEQYRRMAATLHELQVDSQLKTTMITSAVPREGKTLTLVNLGLTLSESYGRRVLMIDADLRRPSLHQVLGVPNERGLSDALREPHREVPLLFVSDRLSVLTGGSPEGLALAALSSPRMQAIIDECAAQFDWVLIDTPPIGILPDASLVARQVAGVVFVIRAGRTPAVVVERAIAEIGRDAIIGTVLNNIDEHRIRAARYYSHYTGARGKH